MMVSRLSAGKYDGALQMRALRVYDTKAMQEEESTYITERASQNATPSDKSSGVLCGDVTPGTEAICTFNHAMLANGTDGTQDQSGEGPRYGQGQ